MKKALSLILALVLCLSLCACGDSNSDPTTIETNPSKPADTTPAIDPTAPTILSEPSTTEPNETEPENTEPTHTLIELTLENWDTYFEFVSVDGWNENAFGEADTLHFYYYYKLKDEYREICNDETSIAIEYSFTYAYHECTVDYAARTYTIHDTDDNACESTDIEDCFFYSELLEGYCINVGWDAGGCRVGASRIRMNDNFKVTRVQGTLCLISQ